MWSAVHAILQASKATPTSLSALRRHIARLAYRYSLRYKAQPTLPIATILHEVDDSEAPDYDDLDGFVATYRSLLAARCPSTEYVRRATDGKFFHLEPWFNLHHPTCVTCQQHTPAGEGAFRHAMEHNESNQCPYADIYAWLSGEWRLPLHTDPLTVIKESEHHLPNHASFEWSPQAMAPELERMTTAPWRTLTSLRPRLVHPAMAVIRDSDLRTQLRHLADLEEPQPPPSTDKKDIDKINQHILAVAAALPDDALLKQYLMPIKVRFCLDSSRNLNPHLAHWPFKYASIQDAVHMLGPGYFMGKLDMKKFFNQLPLHAADGQLLGVAFLDPKDGHWKVFSSRFAQFGASPFPALANAIMCAICRIMRKAGIKVVFMTDDLLICAASWEECKAHMDLAIKILQQLGIRLQDDKKMGPAQQLPFLGIDIDTVARRISIPQSKLDNLAIAISSLLSEARADGTHKVRYKDLESLIGRLNWVAEVMVAGRPHLKLIRACLWSRPCPHKNYLRITLSDDAITDLEWWLARVSNPTQAIWAPFWMDTPPIRCAIFSDASGDVGFGAVVDTTVIQGTWTPTMQDTASSAYKELVPVLLALHRLGPEANGKVVIVTTDNLGNAYAINKGSCKSPLAYPVLCRIFEVAAERQMYLIADWIPRDFNTFCDELSKT